MIPRFFRPPDTSFFLFGPRGTGKTTWMKSVFPGAHWIDLLRPDVFRRFSAHPEHLAEWLKARKKDTGSDKAGEETRQTVVIDEIQKVPELLDMVHALIEERVGWRFVLTGSSARKLKRAGVDLLAGRALLTRMHPFLSSEICNHSGVDFEFDSALKLGLLPVVVDSRTPDRVLSAYVDLYVREEVQMEGLVRNIGNFNRFLEAASFSHAQVLNVSQIARECEVERKVVGNYISILEDLLLAHRVPVFRRRAKRKTVVHDKFYFFDTGVYRSLRPTGVLDRPEEIQGSALEGLVFQHLRAWNDYRQASNQIYYWRTHHGSEVDFVVYGDDGLWAIEVKNAKTLRTADVRGLKSFKDAYPETRCCVLYRGRERFERQSIVYLPIEPFLAALHPGHSLEDAVYTL